jgi:hypothetical protein
MIRIPGSQGSDYQEQIKINTGKQRIRKPDILITESPITGYSDIRMN